MSARARRHSVRPIACARLLCRITTEPLVACKNGLGGNMSIVRGKVATLTAFAAWAALAAPAGAQTIELKISHFVPPNHAFHKWVSAWSDKLSQESERRPDVPN